MSAPIIIIVINFNFKWLVLPDGSGTIMRHTTLKKKHSTQNYKEQKRTHYTQ
jgi:hypothetical protein